MIHAKSFRLRYSHLSFRARRGGRGICFFFLALLLALCSTSTAVATPRIECNSLPSKILAHPVNYCVILPPTYDTDKTRRYPVLYFFHGLGDNEQTFIHTGGFNLVEDLWERGQIGEFVIATPNAGASFYVNSHDGKSCYEFFLVRDFLSVIESRYCTRWGRANRGKNSCTRNSSWRIFPSCELTKNDAPAFGVAITNSPICPRSHKSSTRLNPPV